MTYYGTTRRRGMPPGTPDSGDGPSTRSAPAPTFGTKPGIEVARGRSRYWRRVPRVKPGDAQRPRRAGADEDREPSPMRSTAPPPRDGRSTQSSRPIASSTDRARSKWDPNRRGTISGCARSTTPRPRASTGRVRGFCPPAGIVPASWTSLCKDRCPRSAKPHCSAEAIRMGSKPGTSPWSPASRRSPKR